MEGYIVTDEEKELILSRYLALKYHGWGSLVFKCADHRIIDISNTFQDYHELLKALYKNTNKI